jgi:hypothetical protein
MEYPAACAAAARRAESLKSRIQFCPRIRLIARILSLGMKAVVIA